MPNPVKGVSPDAKTVTNERGGQQSESLYAFHLIDSGALLALAEIMQKGASKYKRDNWRKIPSEEHFNHMLIHYYAYLAGDRTDDHLAHFFTRAMMVYATAKEEENTQDEEFELSIRKLFEKEEVDH